MSEDEVVARVERAARAGWNPGLNDAMAFYATDPGAFLGYEVEGILEGTISAVRYSPDFGFTGLYSVTDAITCGSPGARLGVVHLLRMAGKRLAGCGIATNGVVQKAQQYARMFGFTVGWDIIRHRGFIEDVPRAGGHSVSKSGCQTGSSPVQPADSVPFAELLAYDAAHFGACRASFLKQWIALPGHHALVYSEKDGGHAAIIRGFGVIRQCYEGWTVAPLFADNDEIADVLFRELVAATPPGPVLLDLPPDNLAAAVLARRYKMTPWFVRTVRLYRDMDDTWPLDRIYGITTMALG
jgi:hypothetical protein